MRFMEIELDGVMCRARLNDDKAPKTCQAVWDALPFEGRAVHAQVSGDMFRMLDHTPVGELEIESATFFQHPGSVVYYPPIKEIAFCVGKAQFAATQGMYKLTPLAELEPDFREWAEKGDELRFTGAKQIRFRRAADQSTPFRFQVRRGRKVDVEFDGVRLTATLLDDEYPKAARAFARLLPLQGRASNSMWGAAVTRLYPESPHRPRRLAVAALEPGTTFHWPGYIYYDPADGAVCVCYGDAAEGVQGHPIPLIPVACLDGDIAPYAERAQRQLMEGAKPMSIALVGGAAGRHRASAGRPRRRRGG
jgi:hypothetical protein